MLLSMTSVRQNAIMRRTRNLPYRELSDTQKCELQSERVSRGGQRKPPYMMSASEGGGVTEKQT